MYEQLNLFTVPHITFQQAQDFLDGIEDINAGGCGISALSMLLWLKKHEPERAKKTRIVFGYSGFRQSDFKNNARLKKTGVKNETPEVPSHCWLRIDGVEQDSGGPVQHRMPYKHVVGIQFLKQTIKKGEWNPSFSRSECPKIETTLGISFGNCVKLERKPHDR